MVLMAVATVLVPGVLAVGVTAGSTAAGAAQTAHTYDDGGMIGFGSVGLTDPPMPQPLNSPVFSGVATDDGNGYLLASVDGGVFAFGDATFEGSAGSLPLQGPIVAMATTPDAKGYWLGALDGGVFAYGDAPFFGSMGGSRLNQPIVGMTATPDGKGYWLVASDGGIFAYGDAGFYGSTGSMVLNAPIVGMATTQDGKGYWLVAADGGIFSFGDANFYGSAGGADLPDAAVGMVASPDGGGYLIANGERRGAPLRRRPGVRRPVAGPHGDADLGHHRQQPGDRLLAPRPAGLAVRLLDRHPRADGPRGSDHRRRRGVPDSARSGRPGALLQPVRPLRGVVRAVRHMGLGAGRHPHPALCLHRRHLELGAARALRCPRRRCPRSATPSSTEPVRGAPPPRCTSGS